MTTMLDSTAIQGLRDRLQGDVLLPGDPGFDEARAVWNGRFDPHPAAIARCRTSEDVIAAVTFAREQRLPLAVRSTGHDYAGLSGGENGLTIDLSSMKEIRVDPGARRAVVEPGATWGDFDRQAQAFGLATTGGTVSTVGVAGFTLGGGVGYLARKYGLAVDNLLAADLVTADGRLVHASEAENPDLFWALRGGSGNFGVVTAFHVRLHAVGPEVMTAQLFYPFVHARDVLRFYRDFMAAAPDEVTCFAFAVRVPPVDPFPEEYRGQPAIALVGCHCGSLEQGEVALRPLREFGSPILAAVQPMPYTALQQAFDAGMPKGLRWYSRGHDLRELSNEVIDTVIEFTKALPGPFTMAYFGPMGGAIRRADPSGTAFAHRDAPFSLHIFPGWTDPAEDAELMRWAREFHEAVAPATTGGVYVNFLDRDEADRIPAAYGASLARLARIKAAWDPGNLFRRNQNVPPAQ